MSPSGQRLWNTIDAARARLRREGLLALLGVVLALVPFVLLIGWIAGGWAAWLAPSPMPMLVLLAALLGGAAMAVFFGRRWIAGIDERIVAAAAEERRGLPPGSVRGVLELSRALPNGASAELYRRAEAQLAQELSGTTPWELTGIVGERARQRRHRVMMALGVLAVLTAALGFVAPERSRMGWAPLLSPFAHLTPPPLAPLVVEPGDAEVPRGEGLGVAVMAPGRAEVVLRWRAAGDVPRQRTLAVHGEHAATRIEPIDAETRYWVVAADGAVSDTFRIVPLDPLLVSDLVVDVIYPSYIGRAPERFEGEVPPLAIPAGTELRIQGRATRRLEEIALVRGDGMSRVALEVTGDRFSGRWKPRAAGRYDWAMRDRSGEDAMATPPPLEFQIIDDMAPVVYVTYPGRDTLLGPELRQEVVADARDDYGLRSASLVRWRVRAGQAGPRVEVPIPVEGTPERLILTGLLDFREEPLLPGDTVHYFVRVVDNSPSAQVGVSATFTLRLPGTDELRNRADAQGDALADEAASLAQTARELERSTRDLARRSALAARGGSSGQPGSRSRPNAARSDASGGGRSANVGYREAEEARQLLERQDAMMRAVESMRERTEALRRAFEEAGLQDPELRERLRELSELYDQVLSPENRRQMEEMNQSLEEMDAAELQQSLEDLAERQEQIREQIERSEELLRRAAVEQQMNALAREADELAAQQQALSESMRAEPQPSPERTRQQEQMAERARQLFERMNQLQQRLSGLGEEQAASQAGRAGEQVSQAADAARQAAEQAARQNGPQAGQHGEQAAAGLEQAARTLQFARESMAEAWRDETRQAMEQAANDALALAQRQSELLDAMEQLEQAEAGERGEGSEQGGDGGGDSAQDGAGGDSQDQQGQDQGGNNEGDQARPGQQGRQGGSSQGQGEGGQQGQGQQGQDGQQGSGSGGDDQGGGGSDGDRTGPLGQRSGGESGAGNAGPGNSQSGGADALRSEQMALQQGLEALGRNLSEVSQRSAMVDPEVGSALGRAMLSMQETMEGLRRSGETQRLPTDEARRSVDALNQLALSLLENAEQVEQSESGTGLQEAMEQLGELAREQGALSGQSNSLLPMDLGPPAMARQVEGMARRQNDIARKLGGMNDMTGGSDDLFGQLDELAREAAAIARELSGGRLSPEIAARQERLFHRLLEAGRTLERDEVTEERVGEVARNVGPSNATALDPSLLDGTLRYPVPSPEAMRALPPAYRRLILEYFDRLNRSAATAPAADGAGGPRR